MSADPAVTAGEVRSGMERRAIEIGRTIFDYADDLAVQMPASCQRSGRCHECVVEIEAGTDALGPLSEPESFLRPPYRLACQAVIERAAVIEFKPLRRRLRIVTGDELLDESAPPNLPAGPLVLDSDSPLGLAIDVGTTTVVVELVELRSGRVVAGGAFENPQRFGGSDVMNRISYDERQPGELRRALRRVLNAEIRRLCGLLGLDRRRIAEAMIVGNTTMRDLFFGIDVSPIGQRPYKSQVELDRLAGERSTTALVEPAHRLGLWMTPQGAVRSAPLIASHLGGDVVADLATVRADRLRGSWMLVDIGTNTEVVASDGLRIVAASCPAGPAFEGGLVRYGMPGADGAIERARLVDGQWAITVIGEVPPEGICGSGLVDILGELRRHGRMSPLGVFADRAKEVVIEPVRGITLSRADASNLAQAKAANACGQAILLRSLGLRPDELETVFLAGGFASHLDVSAAIDIGFLAQVRPQRVVTLGNASIRGARALLTDADLRATIERWLDGIEHIELETTPDFFELFVEACRFEPLPDDGALRASA